MPKPRLCLLPEDLNVHSDWNSYLCVIFDVYLCICICVYTYLSMYICVQMFDFDFSMYVCILVFLVLGFFVQTGNSFHMCRNAPGRSNWKWF